MEVFANVHVVAPSEANDFILERSPIILDVRSVREYKEGHIAGAINLPIDEVNQDSVACVLNSTDQLVLVYSGAGTRSDIACGMLSEMGYTNTYDLAGGIDRWTFGLID